MLAAVNEYLRERDEHPVERINARFYLVTGYVLETLKLKNPKNLRFDTNHKRLRAAINSVKKDRLEAVYLQIQRSVSEFQITNPEITQDSLFKSSEFREQFLIDLVEARGN